MKLSKNEQVFLTTLISVSQKLLRSSKFNGVNKTRRRRSVDDVALLERQIRAARRRNVSVKKIADELGVTTSYVY